MNLTTYTRVGVLVVPGETPPASFQSVVGQIIAGVSAAVEQFLGRLIESKSRTEYLHVDEGCKMFRVSAWPVTSVTSIHFDPNQVFGSDTLLTSDDYFNLTTGDSGVLVMKQPIYSPVPFAPASLKIVYTGGMASTTDLFASAYPDIAHAVDLQCAYLYHTRNAVGTTSSSGDSGSYSLQPSDWLPEVKTILERHRARHI